MDVGTQLNHVNLLCDCQQDITLLLLQYFVIRAGQIITNMIKQARSWLYALEYIRVEYIWRLKMNLKKESQITLSFRKIE